MYILYLTSLNFYLWTKQLTCHFRLLVGNRLFLLFTFGGQLLHFESYQQVRFQPLLVALHKCIIYLILPP